MSEPRGYLGVIPWARMKKEFKSWEVRIGVGSGVQGGKKLAPKKKAGWWHDAEVVSGLRMRHCDRQCKSQDWPLASLYTI